MPIPTHYQTIQRDTEREGGKDRDRETETERDSDRDRETQRETETERDRDRDGERQRETERDRDRDGERQRETERAQEDQQTDNELAELGSDGVRQQLGLQTQEGVLPRHVALLPRYHVDGVVVPALHNTTNTV